MDLDNLPARFKHCSVALKRRWAKDVISMKYELSVFIKLEPAILHLSFDNIKY